jgi:hypothetical protein
MSRSIFELLPSSELFRPQIDFELAENSSIDWSTVDDVLRGETEDSKWPKVDIRVHGETTTLWDCYAVPGVLGGLLSERIVNVVYPIHDGSFTLFPARVNGMKYVFLRCDMPTDCFDWAHSDVTTFESDPSQVMEVRKYAFFPDRIKDFGIFSIREFPVLLLTDSTAHRLLSLAPNGIELTRIAEVCLLRTP